MDAARVARMYEEIASGSSMDAREVLQTQFEESHQELVLMRDMPFYSLCEHHLLPFFGSAHVAYIPRGKVVGISKLARTVDIFAKRPQVQERLTSQIADAIMEAVGAEGVAVVLRAEHLCMSMRGVEKRQARMMTSAMLGKFRDDQRSRSEFLHLVGARKT